MLGFPEAVATVGRLGIGALAAIGFWLFTRDGLKTLKRLFARPMARRVFLLSEGGAAVVSATGIWANALPLLTGGLLLGWALELSSRLIVELTGGMEPTEGLRKAAADLAAFTREHHEIPLSAGDQAILDGQLRGLSRWESPKTSAFIELWREAAVAQYSVPELSPEAWKDLMNRLASEAKRVWRTSDVDEQSASPL